MKQLSKYVKLYLDLNKVPKISPCAIWSLQFLLHGPLINLIAVIGCVLAQC
jgi:hypothetical protein